LVNYEPLWRTIKERGITTYALVFKYGINARTISNLKHGRGITLVTLERLCNILNCTPNDVLEFLPDTPDVLESLPDTPES